ncbi:MAG TPA: hypothetical protein VLY87_07760, partial [Flavobacterium sp.]|nr:hypothetical protein [Flavobacterium sp.]
MKRNYKVILIVVALATALWSFIPHTKSNDPDPEKEEFLLGVLNFVLQNAHYHPADLNDQFSEKVYTNYLKVLDPNKRFFLQSDVDAFAKNKTTIDDQFKTQRADFFIETYPVFEQRIKDAQVYYKEILKKPFDFTKKESIDTDYEKQPYANSKIELEKRWQKQLKLSVLSKIETEQELQENDTLNKEPKKSFAELEVDARESVLKSLDEYFEFFSEISREEWLSVYINTLLEQFDPHTNYLAPDDKKKFDESMAGSMEGIGAILRKKGEFV